ncbi:lipoprotein [Spiroplasma floricola]|uniref:Lipoprotein n=1 Tax=Spiroplasma floricola 23-6 TaxID=1336749 RepID=A0A2K8SDT6_9MOLU|nr:lipoprotein [Spiroplasma floricola]AUB31592.1 hypothetical protein SFLOR_v1c05400 [Spiroplasma floricola 23-6]
MKKLLSVLAAISFVSSSTVSVVACGTKEKPKESKPEEPKNDMNEVIQDFKKEVTKIWTQHYEKEVANNLITIEDVKNDYKFLNKENIQKYSKPENKDKLTVEEKKQFTNDVEKLFKAKLLKQQLNELKKVNKYKVILDDVDSVFEHVELLFNDNFEINSGEIIKGSYIGNVIVDYNIVIQYKGLNDVEKFKQSGTMKYTSTKSESFKKVGDSMYKNIAKDMFTSQETLKYVNLKWNEIKNKSKDSDAYVNSNNELKNYYNSNEDFHQALLNLVKEKYFKDSFPTLEINYSKKSIYRSNNFLEENKKYLIVNNFDKENSINLRQKDSREIISKILLGDEEVIKENLKSDIFNSRTLQKNRVKYRATQDQFLKEFLNTQEVENYKISDSYQFAIAMGYADFIGPVIKIGEKENSYMHKLPDFKLAISYSMNGENDEISESLIDLSLKLFNVYKKIWAPSIVTDTKYLFNINYKQQNIWNEFNTRYSRLLARRVNDFLNNYNSFYFIELEKNLNLLNMTRNTFNSSNFFYSINVDNFESNLADISFFNKSSSKYYFEVEEQIGTDNKVNFFDTVNYLTFDLFGIVKMNIYFTKEIRQAIFF